MMEQKENEKEDATKKGNIQSIPYYYIIEEGTPAGLTLSN